MRFVVILLTILMFTGGAVAVSSEQHIEGMDEEPTLTQRLTNGLGDIANAVDEWREKIQQEQAQKEQFARFEEAEGLGCVTPAGTIDEACVESRIGNAQDKRSTYDNVVQYAGAAWQNSVDFTTETANKIGDKVSQKVHATIDPQMQKMRDLRDQIYTTWLWIKWSITFVIALITLYILEPYVSLFNTLLGMLGLTKRRDVNQELLEALAAEIKALRERMPEDIKERY